MNGLFGTMEALQHSGRRWICPFPRLQRKLADATFLQTQGAAASMDMYVKQKVRRVCCEPLPRLPHNSAFAAAATAGPVGRKVP
jgi:hypothetical protein